MSKSMSNQQWEQHYKLWVPAQQGGQINPMGIGTSAIQPAAILGQPINFSQQTLPSSPAPMGTTITTASSVLFR